MGNKLFVRQMKRTVACVAAAATVFSMNPAGLPYAGGQAGAFVVDAATESMQWRSVHMNSLQLLQKR